MTPALLARLNAATATLIARYGKALKPPVAVTAAGATIAVEQQVPLIIDRGAVKLSLPVTTSGVQWVAEVYMQPSDALAWCTAVEAGQDAAVHYNSDVLAYIGGKLSIGVGPGYTGDASGSTEYGSTVYGPIAATPDSLAGLIAAIRAVVQ